MQELYKILVLSLALGTGIAASHLAEIKDEERREASMHHELMGKFAEMEEHLNYNRDKRCTGHYDSTASRKFVDFRAKQLLKLMREIEVNQHKLEEWQLKLDKQLGSLVGPKGSMTADVAELKDFCGLDKSNSHVKFKFVAQDVTTKVGQNVYVVGTTELGNWAPEKAVKLSRNNNTHATADWSGIIKLPRNKNFEYKYIIKENESTEPLWMPGANLTIDTSRQSWATTLGLGAFK